MRNTLLCYTHENRLGYIHDEPEESVSGQISNLVFAFVVQFEVSFILTMIIPLYSMVVNMTVIYDVE